MKLNKSGAASTKNEQVLLGVLGILCVATMCYLFIISPGMEKSKVYSEEIKALELKLKEVENIDQTITAKQKELDTLMVKYDEASAGLPKTDKYPQLFRDVENMATESGLTSIKSTFYEPRLVEFKDNATDPKGTTTDAQKEQNDKLEGMKYLQVDYHIQNDIDKVLAFVDKLENDDRIADIGAIKQTDSGIVVQVFFYVAGGEEKEEYNFN